MDFEPGTDQLRIVSTGGLNARVDPETFVVTEGAKLSMPGVSAHPALAARCAGPARRGPAISDQNQ
jgi:hypothetical protein